MKVRLYVDYDEEVLEAILKTENPNATMLNNLKYDLQEGRVVVEHIPTPKSMLSYKREKLNCESIITRVSVHHNGSIL